jgi:putative transposase
MPDHFHVLITIGQEISIERAVQFIKGGFAFRAGRELGFRPPVWERGFSEVRIHSAEAVTRIHEYISQNPVKRRLVQSATDYPYSSSRDGFDLDKVPQGPKPRGNWNPGRHV